VEYQTGLFSGSNIGSVSDQNRSIEFHSGLQIFRWPPNQLTVWKTRHDDNAAVVDVLSSECLEFVELLLSNRSSGNVNQCGFFLQLLFNPLDELERTLDGVSDRGRASGMFNGEHTGRARRRDGLSAGNCCVLLVHLG